MSNDAGLERLRDRLSDADKDILDAFAKRLTIIKEIGNYKRKNDIEIRDDAQRRKVRDKWLERARSRNVYPLISDVLDDILDFYEDIE